MQAPNLAPTLHFPTGRISPKKASENIFPLLHKNVTANKFRFKKWQQASTDKHILNPEEEKTFFRRRC